MQHKETLTLIERENIIFLLKQHLLALLTERAGRVQDYREMRDDANIIKEIFPEMCKNWSQDWLKTLGPRKGSDMKNMSFVIIDFLTDPRNTYSDMLWDHLDEKYKPYLTGSNMEALREKFVFADYKGPEAEEIAKQIIDLITRPQPTSVSEA